jgi:hypothetical protein
MNKISAAVLLGVPTSEIADVYDDAAVGVVIVTTDGIEYVDRDEPDAEGKTGLMFLRAPDGMRDRESGDYLGTFPVYVSPSLPPEPVDDAEPPAPTTNPLDGLTLDELVTWAGQQTPAIEIPAKDAKKLDTARAFVDAELERRAAS